MSGYTPGPWIAGDDEGSDYYLVGPHDGDGIVYQPVVKLHSEANARLIAAAPDLLAAVQRFLDYESAMDSREDVSGMLIYAEFSDMARAAIAKATGEKQ